MKNTILVVDDQKINRLILEKILSSEYDVIQAENGQQALDILYRQTRTISVVLLDIMMPIVSGYDVLKEMQQNPQFLEIPVIVTTQKDDDEDELKALALGATEFITKPYKPDILRHRINNIIMLREATSMVNKIEKDSLTGIYNKEAFYERCSVVLADKKNEKFDIIAIDIENFKMFNDIYGIREGDRVLQFIANVLGTIVAPIDGIYARLGSDEYIVMIPDRDKCVEKFLEESQKQIKQYSEDIHVDIKYGIYGVDNRAIEVPVMCDRALLAMLNLSRDYDHKISFYDESIRKRLLMEQQITGDMQKALDEGQFEVHLQGKYELKSDKIAGAEALVRWNHPTMGMISPQNFIALFEKNGFITQLDYYVWDKTCQIISDWLASGNKYVPVSVNVSRKDIYRVNLPEVMLSLVRKYGLQPKHLHLEITESAYTENSEQLIETVRELKNAGFCIEMDDFGSGYSTLNMLSELPINILKLDMKFMKQKKNHIDNKSIVSFIITLARLLELQVVAEGVETKEQVDFLREIQCDYVQGYYYARPINHKDFTHQLMDSDVAQKVSCDA